MTRRHLPTPGSPVVRLLAGAGLGLALAMSSSTALADGAAPDSRLLLLRAAGPAPASPDTTWADLEQLLLSANLDAALTDGSTLPEARPESILEQSGALSCGTALTRAAQAALLRAPAERQEQVRLLTRPPRLAVELAHAVPGEPLILRWDASAASRHALRGRDTDGNRIPDLVQATADEARQLLGRLAALTGGWRPDGLVEIRLAATPFEEGALVGAAGAEPVVVLSREQRGPERLAALAHQLAHAAVASLAPDLPPSFDEAVATWLGEIAFAEVAGVVVPARRLVPARHASRSLLSPGIGAARGDALFLRFVTEVLGLPVTWVADALGVLPRHAEEARRAARLGPAEQRMAAVAEALDEILAHHGLSLADAVAAHQAWLLEQDLLDREAATPVDHEMDRLPDELRLGADDVPAFGQLRFGVQPPPGGGLVLDLDPAEPLRMTLMAVLSDGSLRRFPLGDGPVILPAASLRRAVVLVSSPSIPRRWSRWPLPALPPDDALLSVRDDASWPFVLESLAAEATRPGQVTLSWETGSEEDLLGWVVERAVRPSGPWLPVSDVPVPAQSWPDAAASYSFVDLTPRPSQRYHYRVRALTRSGLAELTPAVALRTLPRAH